jgi:hypothetical protein
MRVSEEQRRELFDRLRSILDEETATLLLEVTVPANVELATRADIQELRAEMLLRFTELDGRLTGQIADLDRRITELDGRLTGQITDLDRRITELAGRITELDGRMTGGFADLEKVLTVKLYTRVIPAIGIMLAVATWLG